MNREQWLQDLTEAVRPKFDEIGMPLPADVAVTCGWPATGGTSRKQRTIGQCWARSQSSRGVNEVFISPVLDDSVEVAQVLVHELIHAADDCKHGHKGPFVTGMKALALGGKPTATTVTPEFTAWITPLLPGDYPHKRMEISGGLKKQSTRMLKVSCPDCEIEGDPYVVRMSQKQIDRGCPLCPEHGTQMEPV